jgi:undecaprenyl-diphosphatase
LTVSVGLISIGVVMVILDRLPRASHVSSGTDLSPFRAIAIGLAQACALIPGVSRSGSTIIAGRLAGLNPKSAAEYSFLVSIPIMFGLIAKLLISADDRAYMYDNLTIIIVGNIAAFIGGIAAVSFLISFLSKHGLALFGWYRIVLGSLVILYFGIL